MSRYSRRATFRPEHEVVLEFRGAAAMQFEITHARDSVSIWRSVGTEVRAGQGNEPPKLIGR
ncbi:hypothetical protein [Dactylosporangium cerinum]